jgi:flagellar motor switch protein FliM
MLGGSGRAPDPLPRRPLTDIEVRLARRLMQAIVAGLQSAWRVVTPLTLLGDRIESDAGRAVIAATDEVVVVIACEVTLDSVHGPLQLCIPLRALEPQIRPLIAAGTGEGLAAQTADADGPLVQLTAQLAETTMTMEELLDLQPGDIITTPQSADEPIVVKVEGLPKYQGRAGRNQGRLAVRIEDRISSDDPSSDPGDRGA